MTAVPEIGLDAGSPDNPDNPDNPHILLAEYNFDH